MRSRWSGGGALVAALVALGGLVWWGLGENPPAAGPAEGRAERPAAPRPTLEGRATPPGAGDRAQGPTLTAEDAGAPALRVLAPDGRPAAGVEVDYRAFDQREDLSFGGVTDGQGRLELVPEVAGERCEATVGSAGGWARSRIDFFATGEVPFRLEAGCEVVLELGPSDLGLVGQTLLHASGGRLGRRRIEAQRTTLGRFQGELVLAGLGARRPAKRLLHTLLPPGGSLTLRWEAEPEPPVCWLRFSGPVAGGEAPLLRLVPLDGLGEAVTERAARRRPAPGVVEVAVDPGPLEVLAASSERWARALVVAEPGAEPTEVPLPWSLGAELVVRLPTDPPWMAALAVLFEGRGRLEVEHDAAPGLLRADLAPTGAATGLWPGLPARSGARELRWRGLPPGERALVRLEETPWGALTGEATLGQGVTELVLEPGARFTVRAAPDDGSEPDRIRMTLQELRDPAPAAHETWMEGGRAQVLGLRPGAAVRLALRSALWRGNAEAVVADGLEVVVPVRRRPRARYRARVVDEAGRPVAGIGVSFSADAEFGATALSGADGWAEVEHLADRPLRASTAHEGWWTLRDAAVAPGAPATLVAGRLRSLVVTFDVGEAWVRLTQEERLEGGGAGSASESTFRVVPGSVYATSALPWVPRLWLRAEPADGPGDGRAPSPWFDGEVDLRPATTTALKIAR